MQKRNRAPKVIIEFSKFKCEDRLAKLNLSTLETRIVRDDLIQVFKILGVNEISAKLENTLFEISNKKCKKNITEYF